MHGFGGYFDVARIDWLIDALSEYKLIGIDARGHGRSGKPSMPNDYGLSLVGDVNRLLDHLKLADAHIIGFSMGGLIGLKHASLHPDRVRSLTLAGQGLAPRESFQSWIEMGRVVVESDQRTAEQEKSLNLYSGLLAGYLPLLVTDEEAQALDIPLLVVIGEDDERLEIARNLKRSYLATNLIVAPGYDHSSIVSKESPFALSISGFLKLSEEQH
jgi:pimeloyl-ACP methyl ester carboxylesterase